MRRLADRGTVILTPRQVDKNTQALLSKRFGLDKPLFFNTSGGNPLNSQFFNYIWGAVRGDLGPSYRQRGQDVQDILFKPPEGKPFWYSKFGYLAAPGHPGRVPCNALWHSTGHPRCA